MAARTCQQQHRPQPLLLVAEEAELFDNDKLPLPCSTRLLKRRISLFEKSRDWARRLITLHRARRNTTTHDKIRESCCQMNKTQSHHEFLSHQSKSFDEDGYLSPMEIQSQLDKIARETPSLQHHHQSLSKLPTKPRQQLIVYSHSSSDISQPVYRCHGPIATPPRLQCTCHQQQSVPNAQSASEFHKSISIVDYIDFDVAEESSPPDATSKDDDDDDDPLGCVKYLFDDGSRCAHGNFVRRAPRRSTNTSSISADSGYCDMPVASSKLIPVHLISCTLIPVNVTRTESMDIRCLTCTCPSSSSHLSTSTERRRRKSSTHSARSHLPIVCSRPPAEALENETSNQCLCHNKYYSTMTICPTLPLSSVVGAKSVTKIDVNQREDYYTKQQQKKLQKKKRPYPLKLSTTADDLTSVLRWYKPNFSREAICHALQQADYGAFALRKSTTHPDCYALSVKVPKFSHESNIAHYLIEKVTSGRHTPSYRIKGTMKQFPTLLSLLTHHSVMPEILPITLNLNALLAV